MVDDFEQLDLLRVDHGYVLYRQGAALVGSSLPGHSLAHVHTKEQRNYNREIRARTGLGRRPIPIATDGLHVSKAIIHPEPLVLCPHLISG